MAQLVTPEELELARGFLTQAVHAGTVRDSDVRALAQAFLNAYKDGWRDRGIEGGIPYKPLAPSI